LKTVPAVGDALLASVIPAMVRCGFGERMLGSKWVWSGISLSWYCAAASLDHVRARLGLGGSTVRKCWHCSSCGLLVGKQLMLSLEEYVKSKIVGDI
jgi:hypothetical protein